MKKLLFITMILFTLAMSLSALDFTIGPKVSYGDYSNWGSDWKDLKDTIGMEDKFSSSFSGGVFFITHFSPLFSIQIDGLFSHQTYRYTHDFSSGWEQYNFNSIIIPVYARFDFQAGAVNIFAIAGPRFDIFFDKFSISQENGSSSEGSISEIDQNNFLLGASLGLGVSFPAGPGKMEIGAVYYTNFSKMNPDADIYHHGIELQLGYGFDL